MGCSIGGVRVMVLAAMSAAVSPAFAAGEAADPPSVQTAQAADKAVDWAARGDAAADYSSKLAGRAVLIMHDGEVVYERYDNGWKPRSPHMLASGTKSFSGVLAMFAVQDGLLELDEPACDTIAEWRNDERKKRITVRMLLDLSSGLDPAEETIGSAGRLTLRDGTLSPHKGPKVDDKFAAAIAVEAVNEPGKKFVYGPSHFYAFGELLQRKLEARNAEDPSFPVTVTAYMHARIFEPLSIYVSFFGKDAEGNPNLPGGCFLSAREWAKFGEFVRLGGVVRAPTAEDPVAVKRLLKRELLDQCFVPSSANPAYGLTWWLPGNAAAEGAGSDAADMPLRERLRARAMQNEASASIVDEKERRVKVWMAAGLGKQRLYVLPDHGLVVVRFAENAAEGRGFDNAAFLGHVLGVKKDGSAPRGRGRGRR